MSYIFSLEVIPTLLLVLSFTVVLIYLVLVKKQTTQYTCMISRLPYWTTQNDYFKKNENERSVFIKKQ